MASSTETRSRMSSATCGCDQGSDEPSRIKTECGSHNNSARPNLVVKDLCGGVEVDNAHRPPHRRAMLRDDGGVGALTRPGRANHQLSLAIHSRAVSPKRSKVLQVAKCANLKARVPNERAKPWFAPKKIKSSEILKS